MRMATCTVWALPILHRLSSATEGVDGRSTVSGFVPPSHNQQAITCMVRVIVSSSTTRWEACESLLAISKRFASKGSGLPSRWTVYRLGLFLFSYLKELVL